MSELQVLDELVPLHDERPDWDDVLRRARRGGPRTRILSAVAVAVCVFGVAPALAVVLLRGGPARLPSGADRSHVAVVMEPATGRVLLEAAPWKGHDGFCYVALSERAGCVPRKRRGTVLLYPPLFGWSFDPGVRSGTVTVRAGKRVPLRVVHFGGRIDVTLFVLRGRLPVAYRSVTLRNEDGTAIVIFRQR